MIFRKIRANQLVDFKIKSELNSEFKIPNIINVYLNPTELNNKFEVEWKKEKEKEPKKQSLLNACIQSTKPSLWIWSIVFYVTGLVINFFPSIVLKQLLDNCT